MHTWSDGISNEWQQAGDSEILRSQLIQNLEESGDSGGTTLIPMHSYHVTIGLNVNAT